MSRVRFQAHGSNPSWASRCRQIRIRDSFHTHPGAWGIAVDTMEPYGRMRPTRGAWFRIAIALWMLTELELVQRERRKNYEIIVG